MDDLDRKILSLLAKNARMPVKEIAEQVALTSPAVSSLWMLLETAGLVSATFSAISFTGIRAFFARRARILRSKSSMGKVLLLKYVTLSKIFRK